LIAVAGWIFPGKPLTFVGQLIVVSSAVKCWATIFWYFHYGKNDRDHLQIWMHVSCAEALAYGLLRDVNKATREVPTNILELGKEKMRRYARRELGTPEDD
jgi:hypothetical protein